MSERRACHLIGIARRVARYKPSRPDDTDLRQRLRELAAMRRRFGYRRLGYLLPRIADLPQQRLHELLPWNWKKQQNMAPGTP